MAKEGWWEPQKLHRVPLSNMSLPLENISRMTEYYSGFILLRCIASQKVHSMIEDIKMLKGAKMEIHLLPLIICVYRSTSLGAAVSVCRMFSKIV